jgi:phosphatidylserine decarboxylase
MYIVVVGVLVVAGVLTALMLKLEIPQALSIPTVIAITAITGGIGYWMLSQLVLLGVVVVALQLFLALALFGVLLLTRFFRDPERACPQDETLVLSPADGTIVYVKAVENGTIPFAEKHGRRFALTEFVQTPLLCGSGVIVGIGMCYLDVHVNRAPIEGTIKLLNHVGGLFESLKRKTAVVENERVVTLIEDGDRCVGVVQIASRLVRQIIPYVRVGHSVEQGQRIGRITFGSQVDVIIPLAVQGVKVQVQPGQRVKAGESILAVFGTNV